MDSHTVRGSHRLDVVNSTQTQRSASESGQTSQGPLGIIKALALVVLAVALGLIGTGGTYAYLNASATVTSGSSISAGTAALSVGSQSLTWSQLAPGQSVAGSFSITNIGDVPLVLSATSAVSVSTSLPADTFVAKVSNGACPSSGIPTSTLNGTLSAGATVNACLVITLSANAVAAAQSASATVTTTINGVQP